MTLKRLAQNTLSLTLAEVVIKLIAFGFNLIIARLLGAGLYGQYSFINAFVAIFSFLPDLGTNLIVIREVAKYPHQRRLLTGQALTTNFIFSLLSFLLIAAIFPAYAQDKALLLAALFAAAGLALS